MTDNKQLHQPLAELGFSEHEIAVYLSLTELGESRAAAIAKKAGLKRTTAISILGALKERGLITSHVHRGVIHYWIESPRLIEDELKSKLRAAEGLHLLLADLYRSAADFPLARVYDTKAGFKRLINQVIHDLPRGGLIRTIDSPHSGNYERVLYPDGMMDFYAQKTRRRIQTKTLIPSGQFVSVSPHKLTAQSIEIREMPPAISFGSALWLINDTIIMFSGRYPFAVSVRHQHIAESLISLWDYLWSVSRQAGR